LLREAFAKLSRHTLTYALSEQLGRVAGFVLLPMTTRLGGADFGIRELLAVTLPLLAQLAGLNVTAAMSRYYFEDRDEARRRRVISTTFLSVAGVAAAVAVLCAFAAGPVVSALVPDAERLTRLFRIALALLFFQVVREVLNKVLQTQERSLLYGALSVSKVTLEVSLQVWFFLGLGWGLEGLLLAVLAAEASSAALLAAILLPRIGLAFSGAIFSALFAYSLPLVPNGVLQFCLHSSDRYFLGAIAGRGDVGLYALAYKLGYMPNYLVLGPFLLIWYPYVFSIAGVERQREFVGRFAPYLMLLITAVTFAVALFAREIVAAVSAEAEFDRAWIAVAPVALGYWLWALFQVLQTGFYVVKVTRPLPLLTLAAALVNAYLNVLWIPLLGFQGAAFATVATFAVLAMITALRARSVFPVAMEWRRILAPATVAAVLVALASLVRTDSGAALAAKAAVFAAWSVWAWYGGFFRRDERAAALSVARSWSSRAR
jgi:O-antigen/teichoic acid export membrane protein